MQTLEQNVLVENNLKLVYHIAFKFFPRGAQDRRVRFFGTWDDVIQEGNVALMRASRDFDPNYGTQFSTFACRYINQAYLDKVRRTRVAEPCEDKTLDETQTGKIPSMLRSAIVSMPGADVSFYMGRLKSADRNVLRSYFWAGKSQEAIATEAGIHAMTVGNRMRSSLAQLRDMMEEDQ